MKEKTRKLTLMAMLAAVSYLVMLVGRIPVVMFLRVLVAQMMIMLAV